MTMRPEGNPADVEFTDAEVAAMVEETTERATAAAIGWDKSRVHRTVVRHRKHGERVAAEARAKYEAERRASRQALTIAQPEQPSETGVEPQAPTKFAPGTTIRVQAQHITKDDLFARAVTITEGSDEIQPLTLVSAASFDKAIRWAESGGAGRVTTVDYAHGGRGSHIFPMIRANPSADQAQHEEGRMAVMRRFFADELYRIGCIARYGEDIDASPEDRSLYTRAFIFNGAAVNCYALVGHEWLQDSTLLRRQLSILRWDARRSGTLPGLRRPQDIDNRIRVDEFTVQLP